MLAVDRDQIAKFVLTLFRYAPAGSYVQMRAFRDDRDGTWRPDLWSAPQVSPGLEAVIEGAFSLASLAAAAPVPVVFAPPIVALRSPSSAAEGDVAAGLVLTVECDANPAGALRALIPQLGNPTVMMESGGLWTDPGGVAYPKVHLHWVLSRPTTTPDEHSVLKATRRLAQRIAQSDGTAVPLVHPLRWPGSWHRKGTPRMARIVHHEPTRELDLFRAHHFLERAVGPTDDLPRSNQSASPRRPVEFADLAAALAALPNADLPWDEWNRIAMAAWSATAGSPEGLAAFVEWSSKSPKHSAAACEARWRHFFTSPPDRIGAGTIFYLAAPHVPPAARALPWRRTFVNPPTNGHTLPAVSRVARYLFRELRDPHVAAVLIRAWHDKMCPDALSAAELDAAIDAAANAEAERERSRRA
jgi:hypothetical protein